jgi:hypothetical protein
MSQKRQKLDPQTLQNLVHTKAVSQSALESILAKLSSLNIIQETVKRDELAAASHVHLGDKVHVERVQLKSGKQFEWNFVDPARLIPFMISHVEGLEQLYLRAFQAHPGRRWRCLVTFDEFAPGNKMLVDNKRKAFNLSFSFIELSADALSQDVTWFTPVVVRSKMVSESVGGWSYFLKVFLKKLFFSPTGLSTAGVPVVVGGTPRIIHADLHGLLGDLDGLRAAYDWRGSSSLKPCVIHHNLLKKGSDLAHRGANLVEVSCHDLAKLQAHTSQSLCADVNVLLAAQRRCDSGGMSKARLEEISKMSGINVNPSGLLADRQLQASVDFVQIFRVDWMHTYLQDGCFSFEGFAFLESIGLRADQIKKALEDDWVFPKASSHKSKALSRIFDACRQGSSGDQEKLKASASELVGVYGLLRHLADMNTALPSSSSASSRASNSSSSTSSSSSVANAKRESFLALCACIDCLMLTKRGRVKCSESPRVLADMVQRHFAAHLRAYGESLLKPKHHYTLHIPPQIAADGFLFDSFTCERLHLSVKKVAEAIRNTSTYEFSVLSAMIASQSHGSVQFDKLNPPVVEINDCGGCSLSTSLRCHGHSISVGDVVVKEDGVPCKVLACISQAGKLYLAVRSFALGRRVSKNTALWRALEEKQIMTACSVFCALAWKSTTDGLLVIIM